ncbi:MAG: hypothetical protein AB1649_15290 [Chloroflexota bacterium]
MDEEPLRLVRLLLARLERISADSFWAHRASGVRGSLARMLDHAEKGDSVPASELKRVIDLGFRILERAAREKVR